MHCLNRRIGILFRENTQKKSYELRYFFIDDEANLFYVPNLARLQKMIRLSSDLKQLRMKLIQIGEKTLPVSLNKYSISDPRPYKTQAVVPFVNRLCLELKEKDSKDTKGYLLFGLVDDDTPYLFEEILVLTGLKKVPPLVRKRSHIDEQKDKTEQRTVAFFRHYTTCEPRFRMACLPNASIEFQGNVPPNEAEGKCVQILIDEKITYSGNFKQGQKWGSGLIVNESLDSFDCEFVADELPQQAINKLEESSDVLKLRRNFRFNSL